MDGRGPLRVKSEELTLSRSGPLISQLPSSEWTSFFDVKSHARSLRDWKALAPSGGGLGCRFTSGHAQQWRAHDATTGVCHTSQRRYRLVIDRACTRLGGASSQLHRHRHPRRVGKPNAWIL